MKKIIFITIVAMLSISLLNGQNCEIKGNLKKLKVTSSEMSYTGKSAEIYGDNNVKIKAKDTTGDFIVAVKLSKPAYYTLGRNTVYIRPGEKYDVILALNPADTKFLSGNIAENKYLAGAGRVEGVIPLFKKITDPATVIIRKIDSSAVVRLAELSNLKSSDMDFNKNEELRIKAEKINAAMRAISMISAFDKGSKAPDTLMLYAGKLIPELMANPSGLDVKTVRTAITDSEKYKNFGVAKSSTLLDLEKAKELSALIDKSLNAKNRDSVLNLLAGINDASLKTSIEAKITARGRFFEGTVAPDITLEDVNGNFIKMSSLKGTPLFVDFWATWCMPCLAQAPSLKEVSAAYPKIKFIALSVDQDKNAWLKKVKSEVKEHITDYRADVFEAQSAWDVNSIPRFILIDENFRIINAFSPRPSDKEKINELLGKYK
jgi:thiol-disulfide isomerase/thioredoxin